MLKNLKNSEKKTFIINLVSIIVGILFCFLKNNALKITQTIVSFILMIYGILLFLIYFSKKSSENNKDFMTEGIVYSVLGFIINIYPELFIFGIALVIMLDGIYGIVTSIRLKKMKDKKWWVKFIIYLIPTLLSVTCNIFSFTYINSNIVSVLFGVLLLTEAIINFVIMFVINRKMDSKEKKINDFIDDFKDYKIT